MQTQDQPAVDGLEMPGWFSRLHMCRVIGTCCQSARGLADSKTLRELWAALNVRELLECGSLLPLSHLVGGRGKLN